MFEYDHPLPGANSGGWEVATATSSRGDHSRPGLANRPLTHLESSPYSKIPLVWLSSWRRVIARPFGTSPGSQRSTESVRVRRFPAASCSTTVATKGLVTLAIR